MISLEEVDTLNNIEPATAALSDKSEDDHFENEVNPLIDYLEGQFNRAEQAREVHEARWLKAYRAYRGIYSEEDRFTSKEKSKVFVRVTKTKVLAAYGQITDVLFAGQKFPLTVEATRVPEGIEEAVHIDPAAPEGGAEDLIGFPGDGRDLAPGDTHKTLLDRTGAFLREKLAPLADKLRPGPGKTATAITFNPASDAAKRMEKQIHDQLEESSASKHLRHTSFECALLGTGVLKGPFAEDKEYPRWEEDGSYVPVIKTVPKISSVCVWNFYPDPEAANMEEAEFVFQRHKMSRSELLKLKRRPLFRSNAIDSVIESGYNYTRKHWEGAIGEDTAEPELSRYDVREYWGYLDAKTAEEAGLELPELDKENDSVQVNVWYSGGQVIRLVVNPFQPQRIPYMAVPYEVNPYSIFGIGVAENMEDTQRLMNGFMRLAVDNAVLSGNLIFEIDETNLIPGQDKEIYPGKIFFRQGGAPGQALFSTHYPNVSQQNMMMFDKARVLADESTGIPSFSHGQTGVQGTGRTAAGISMLMGASQLSIKTVVKNIDDYLLHPLGSAYFAFNMQFSDDASIKGDLEVKARGTESLMRNEVRSQRLLQLLQLGSNQVLAPFVKFPVLLREIAQSMDLDGDNLINDEREAVIQAEIFKAMSPQMPQSQEAQGVPAPDDMTGGGAGNIGMGGASLPGEPQFTGTDQGERQQV